MPLHIMQRGVNKAACFDGSDDHQLYLGLLAELSGVYGCEVHAYVLMTNHVHLLTTPIDPEGASLLMRNVGQRYVQAFNRRHKRCGPLWNDRFKASVVDSESYLFTCYRYIELNPVRAGMVAKPQLYPWSSYGFNALGIPSTFLVPRPEYLAMGPSHESRTEVYRALLAKELTEGELGEVRAAINANAALGSESFVSDLEQRLGVKARAAGRGRPSQQEKKAASPV